MQQRNQSDIISSHEVKSVVLEACSKVFSSGSNLAEATCPDNHPKKMLWKLYGNPCLFMTVIVEFAKGWSQSGEEKPETELNMSHTSKFLKIIWVSP